MKHFTEKKIQSLKTLLCEGDKEAVRILSEYFFPEIWANLQEGTIDEQTDALINLEIDLWNNRLDFCQSDEPVEFYLRKKWKQKLAAIRKVNRPFDEKYMGDPTVDETPIPDESVNVQRVSIYPYQHLLAALDPIERMLFEAKYFQNLNGKNGLFQVTHFLLNAAAIGNPPLRELLEEKAVLHEPLIENFLITQAKNAFTNQVDKGEETLLSLLQHLPMKRSQLKDAFHNKEMKVFRINNAFKVKSKLIKELSKMEQAFVWINEYRKYDHIVLFWACLNIDAQIDPELKEALIKHQLFENGFLKKHLTLSGHSITKKLLLGKKRIQFVETKVKAIQQQINIKIQKKIQWKIQ